MTKHVSARPSKAEKHSRDRDAESEKKEFVPEYDAIVGLSRSKLPDIVQEHDQLSRRIAADTARLKELKQAGAELMAKAGVKVVMCAGLRVTQIDGVSSRLDKALLVKAHGTKVLGWLKDATVQTKYISLRVKEPGKGNGGDGSSEGGDE